MKSILSVALLFGLGLSATAVQANPTSPSCGASTFPATGQTSSFPPTFKITDAPVHDDGFVKAGGALRYQNNGDGTITDLNTGLMWEQKIKGALGAEGLHDVNKKFPWDSAATTIWDWLEGVNTEGGIGLGGHNDWRIPNVKELQSIVNYGTFNPAVDVAFNNNPGLLATCGVADCSLTAADSYWSSTTGAANASSAWAVSFFQGHLVGFFKNVITFVRAVRGGCLP
jgi:hypothetical protein